jgi:PBSX family phage terminase large subunit
MILSKPQQLVANDPHRFKVVIAGRRFGKTFLAIRQLCWFARRPNSEIFYITSSYRAAKMIVWKPLKRRLQDLRWVKKINEAELSITLKNGSTISLKGGENPDALRGPSLTYVVIDEAADVDPVLWQEVIRPALADQQGHALFIGTPKGKNNWTYDLYNLQYEYSDVWKSWQFTTIEGGFVKQEEVEQARKDMSLKQFRQEFEATFETAENRVAWAFERQYNCNVLDNADTRIIHIGMDFNVSPATAAIFVEVGNTAYQIDEVVMFSSNTNEMVDEIDLRFPNSKKFVYPDPAGSQRRTSANNQTDHTILHNAGYIVKAPRKHDAVRDRINATNARFCSADGIRHLFINPKCKYSIESLEKFSFKEGTQVPDKDSGFDHMFDAMSYYVAFRWPIKRDIDPDLLQPQRWGVALG